MNAKIHLKNMAFFGYHGHLAEENSLGQRFQIDAILHLDITEAAATDDINYTVNYTKIYDITRALVETTRCKLIETLAARIIDNILQHCPRVTRVDLTIRKPSAPIAGVLEYVALEAGKTRS